MLALADTFWTALGVVGAAIVTGTFTFMGVRMTVMNQKRPHVVDLDRREDDLLCKQLSEMTQERDVWRRLALDGQRMNEQRIEQLEAVLYGHGIIPPPNGSDDD